MKDFKEQWNKAEKAYVPWYYIYNYVLQLAVYREIVRQNFGEPKEVGLISATKEEIPKQIIIPQEVILEQPILSKNEVQDQPIILKEEKDEIFVPESKKTVMNFYDNEDDDDFDLPSLK